MVAKKIFIGCAILLVLAIGAKVLHSASSSQEERAQGITEKMARKLALSAEQKTQVYQINLKRALAQEEAYKRGRDKETLRSAVAEWETELRQILTAEQMRQLHL